LKGHGFSRNAHTIVIPSAAGESAKREGCRVEEPAVFLAKGSGRSLCPIKVFNLFRHKSITFDMASNRITVHIPETLTARLRSRSTAKGVPNPISCAKLSKATYVSLTQPSCV
jgi:hypothetical protein